MYLKLDFPFFFLDFCFCVIVQKTLGFVCLFPSLLHFLCPSYNSTESSGCGGSSSRSNAAHFLGGVFLRLMSL